jgi:hypothetical protein
MPTVLNDPSPALYIILAIVVVMLTALYLRSRKRGDLIRLVVGAAALAALFIIDRLVESPREEATRKMREIVVATQAKKGDDLFKNVSESFSWNGLNKVQFRQRWDGVAAIPDFHGIDVDNLGRGDYEPIDDHKVKIGFDVWPRSYGLPEYRYYCRATFVKDPDGQFRMQTFDLFKKRGDEKPVVPEQIR